MEKKIPRLLTHRSAKVRAFLSVGFVWLLKLLDTDRSPITSNGTVVVDLINLVNVEFEKAMIRALSSSYHPTAYPTLETLDFVAAKRVLSRLDTGKEGRELFAQTMMELCSGKSVTADAIVNKRLCLT
jgi:hypothetical protein